MTDELRTLTAEWRLWVVFSNGERHDSEWSTLVDVAPRARTMQAKGRSNWGIERRLVTAPEDMTARMKARWEAKAKAKAQKATHGADDGIGSD